MRTKPTLNENPLPGGLLLKSAATKGDVERVAALNGEIHGEGVAGMTRSLFLHHPATLLDDLVFVEEEKSGRVVSSLCLIPWTWRVDGVEVRAGEMGLVGTLEEYRRRGLIRAQVALFDQRLRERGCLFSNIQGIPYFYRQFGYEYALPLEGGLRLETRHVPDPPGVPFSFRPATKKDLPILATLYDEAAQDLDVHTVRDEDTWRYLLTRTQGTEMEQKTWIVERAGEVAGYACVPRHHFDEELAVSEVSRLGFDAALAVLDHLKKLALERKAPGIRLNLPASFTLTQVARSLGAYDLGTYAWQIRVPDYVPLLRALAPALERRIAASPFAGLARELRIGLYRETLALRFDGGRLAEVANLGHTGGEEICFPPLQFIPLLLGYRTREELCDAYPDARIAPAERMLIDTLFPGMTAFLHTVY